MGRMSAWSGRRYWPSVLSILLLVVVSVIGIVIPIKTERPKKAEVPLVSFEPLPHQLELVSALSRESVTESIERLHNFDDVTWANSSIPTMPALNSYAYEIQFIPALARVRKVLAEGPSQRGLVTPLLKHKLVDAVEGFEQSRIAFNRSMVNGQAVVWKPEGYSAKITDGPAITYLLSELRCFDALPLMARVFETQQPIPMSRFFLFYAMHVMALEHPRESLSPQALQAFDNYRKATTSLPLPRLVSVSAWNATLTESTDWRVMILQQDTGWQQQPQILIHYYPVELAKYDEGGVSLPVPVVQEWFKKLKEFINLAYPE